MHLIQVNNTLRAQINLGADATVRRINAQGQPIRDMDSLIRCSRFGGIYRNSDPHIGFRINNLAYQDPLITVENPVGLYFDSYDFRRLVTPDGTNANDFWKYTRGTTAAENNTRHDYWVRGVFEVPAHLGYVVGDIEDSNGEKLQWGSQLADHIRIRLTGWAIKQGLYPADAHHCRPQPSRFKGGDESEEVCRYSGIEDEIGPVCL